MSIEILDAPLPPCPNCGGMLVLVDVPKDGRVVWCTSCDECYPPSRFEETR